MLSSLDFALLLLYVQLANDGIRREVTQSLLDTANYTFEKKNGTAIVHELRTELSKYFQEKKFSAENLAEKVKDLYDSFLLNNHTISSSEKLSSLPRSVYWDSDIRTTLNDSFFKFDS